MLKEFGWTLFNNDFFLISTIVIFIHYLRLAAFMFWHNGQLYVNISINRRFPISHTEKLTRIKDEHNIKMYNDILLEFHHGICHLYIVCYRISRISKFHFFSLILSSYHGRALTLLSYLVSQVLFTICMLFFVK